MTNKIKCYCEYEWITASEMKFVSCPNCLRKVENPYYKDKKIKKQGGIKKC